MRGLIITVFLIGSSQSARTDQNLAALCRRPWPRAWRLAADEEVRISPRSLPGRVKIWHLAPRQGGKWISGWWPAGSKFVVAVTGNHMVVRRFFRCGNPAEAEWWTPPVLPVAVAVPQLSVEEEEEEVSPPPVRVVEKHIHHEVVVREEAVALPIPAPDHFGSGLPGKEGWSSSERENLAGLSLYTRPAVRRGIKRPPLLPRPPRPLPSCGIPGPGEIPQDPVVIPPPR